MAYPRLMMEILPFGLKGLMVASLLAAFMSTISTQLNWGASYLVHDFYRSHFGKNKSERHYIRASMVATFIVLICAGMAAYFTESVTSAFQFIIAFGSGTGPVYILRWFWWRINAWSEISAMIASSVITLGMPYVLPNLPYGGKLALITFGSAAIWITVTLLTKPAPLKNLMEFYQRTKPVGRWEPVRKWGRANGQIVPQAASVSKPLIGWFYGLAFVLGLTIGNGYIVLLNPVPAVIWCVISVVGLWGLWKEKYLRTT